MRFSKGFFSLLLFLAAGALIGGILGQVLGSANLVGLMPFLTGDHADPFRHPFCAESHQHPRHPCRVVAV